MGVVFVRLGNVPGMGGGTVVAVAFGEEDVCVRAQSDGCDGCDSRSDGDEREYL